MKSPCSLLFLFAALSLGFLVSGTPVSRRVPPSATNPNGLHNKFVAHPGKKYFGTALDANTLQIQAAVAIADAEFGTVTPENSMKWDATEASRGNFNFARSDTFVDWAVSHNKLIRGHTLVWHSQLPSWVSAIVDKETLTSVIEDHIAAVAGRYKSKVYAWDVCNELFNEDGTLRASVFQRVLGESFITTAFQAARKADPNAVLYINDYNIEADNPKLRGLVNLVTRVNKVSPGTIDAIGLESHLPSGGSAGLETALTIASSAPVQEVAITELDVTNANAADYAAVVKACLAVSKCAGISIWGITESRSRTGLLPWDTQYRPRPAYYAMIDVLG